MPSDDTKPALTPLELKLLREINGDAERSPWGAWVGACSEALCESGYIDSKWRITDKGTQYLKDNADAPTMA